MIENFETVSEIDLNNFCYEKCTVSCWKYIVIHMGQDAAKMYKGN